MIEHNDGLGDGSIQLKDLFWAEKNKEMDLLSKFVAFGVSSLVSIQLKDCFWAEINKEMNLFNLKTFVEQK